MMEKIIGFILGEVPKIVQKQMDASMPFDIYQVKESNFENFTVNVKHLTLKKEYTDVPICSLGLGNYKGVMKLPKEGDLVFCAQVKGVGDLVVLGNVFDTYTTKTDNIPTLNEGEFLIVNQTLGAIFLMNSDNSIVLTTGNKSDCFYPKIKLDNLNKYVEVSTGDGSGGNEGAKMRLFSDGSFKLFNKDGYGIECSASGEVTIRDASGTETVTSTPGSW